MVDKNIYPYRRYWPHPPLKMTMFEYQDINNDTKIQ